MSSDKNNYESSLTGLAKHYGSYFEDTANHADSKTWNHVFDYDNFKLLAVREKSNGVMNKCLDDWNGLTCYEYFNGITSPCEDCYIKKIGRDNFYACIRGKTDSDRKFFILSLLIEYNGRPAVTQKIIDVTDPVYMDIVVNEYMCIKNFSDKVFRILLGDTHITESFENMCREICEFFDADRALVTEYCSGKLNASWSRLSQPFTQVCTELSEEAIENITKAISGLNYIWIPDVSKADKLDSALREYWVNCDIHSILLIPMLRNGTFIGTVSLHNIRRHFNAIDTLKMLGMAVAKNIYFHIMEAKAEKQLYTDPLTGAYNLSGLKRRAYEILREYPESKYYFCIMDIRYFGGINRRYGFELGDKILIKTAEMLEKYMDKDEVFCRISADVFCFMAKYPGKEAVYDRFAKFADEMQCFEPLKSADYTIEFQCGAYVLNGDKAIAQAIDKAELARRTLKTERGSNVVFFSNELLEKNKRDIALLQDFRHALAHGELTVYFQPQYNYSLQRTVGAEALIRWHSPKHGNVSPADFVPLLERNGLIHELDRFVWEEVCRYQQKWLSMGFECPVSVNLSRHDVLGNNICEELSELLDRYGIPKRLIPLEITETAYIKNSESLIKVVNKLKETGFIVEMDDFGSGYSSLNALKDIPVDLLKLDMKFLDMESNSGKGESIIKCIVIMTQWLDLSVLAEGVETKEQAEYLKSIGCDLMQGYYFARPMPADEFEKKLISAKSSDN